MLERIKQTLQEFAIKDKPLVVFSAMFPFMRYLGGNADGFCTELIDILQENSASLFMPTFVSFSGDVCNLDTEVSTTGALTEIFRKRSDTERTLSAFFPFSVSGDDRDEVCALEPADAWGDSSLYEWFEQNDAYILTLGCHTTHCSFTHRVEWLCKEIITYRYDKDFVNKIIYKGKERLLNERLFVRQLEPEPVNDWTWATNTFLRNGMQIVNIEGIKLSLMNAKNKIETLLPLVKADPLVLLKNKEDFSG